MYTQVTVRRGDQFEDVWWIESRFAVAGKRIRDEQGIDWTVIEVFGDRDRAFLNNQADAQAQLAYVLGESDENPRAVESGWCEIWCT